ncbi:hypothetical protein [Thalassospira sp. HJ]|uniref:hypothetical protein n=1 Tax=Thalassospira sp. HJ TaxID=1616823 RepID=UPI000A90C842|nr:hypothetical protein [Thalassospira sp. HJ]
MTKALGARDLSPPARLLTTENFAISFNPEVKTPDLRQSKGYQIKPFPEVSEAYDLYVGFIFKNSK